MSKFKRDFKMLTTGLILGGVLFSGVSYATSATSIDVYFQPLKYFFDGVEKKAPAEQQGFIYQGTTYVPLRFVSESLGKEVGYDGATTSIYVGKQPEGQKKFLDDTQPLSGSMGYFKQSSNFKTNSGKSFTHALYYDSYYPKASNIIPLTQEYLLNGNYNKFEAFLAPHEGWSQQSISDDIGQLKIYADDKLVYDSGVIASNISTPVRVDASIKGALKVKIVITSGYLGLLDAGFVS